MENEKILFCDIDDVLINSSDFIQKYVNANTVFKTDMLKVIEQQKRNCQYYFDRVQEECTRAFNEERLPNLSIFPNMEKYMVSNVSFASLNSSQIKMLYKDPVSDANNYLKVANSILEQFLEQRDMFLELDNLSYGETKNYDYEKEKARVLKFKNDLKENQVAIEKINEFCYIEAKRISSEAMVKREKPIYGALIKMDKNDIIRTGAVSGDFIDTVYIEPCNDVHECISKSAIIYAIENLNIEKKYSQEIVKYDLIYREENVNDDAKFAIQDLIASKIFDKVCFITHHNGAREEAVKRKLMQDLFPGSEFLGLRFHSSEHNLERRQRSSKFEKAKEAYGDRKENMILLDDSMDNCNNWFTNGGSVILYRKITPAEKISGLEQFPYPRITDFDYLTNRIEKIINKDKNIDKVKKLEKK